MKFIKILCKHKKIIIWLPTNIGIISKNYNKLHEIKTNNIKIFDKNNYIPLRNITCSHPQKIHMSFKISKNLHITYKLFKKWNCNQPKDHFKKYLPKNHYQYEDIHTFTYVIIQKFCKTLKILITFNLNLY